MKKNMGNADRIIRIVVALVIAALYLTGIIEGTIGVIALVLAAVFLLTSIVSFCPLYLPFKINTGASEEKTSGSK